MRGSRFYNPQFDLFLPTIVDLRFRDQKDTMERPFFSLSKSKRMKPIEYVNENDGIRRKGKRVVGRFANPSENLWNARYDLA